MNFESNNTSTIERDRRLIDRFEGDRIEPDDSFRGVYTTYTDDMKRADELEGVYRDDTNEAQLGKVAEALVYTSLNRHEINEFLQFRPASHYDDFFHGTDVLVEPKVGSSIPALAAIDITIDQEDIKGKGRRSGDVDEVKEARPVGLESKLLRSKKYTDFLANYNPNGARNLSGWIESGGLHEPINGKNKHLFKEAEKLFLTKYYKTPDTDPEPQKPGFVIGGPQTIISVDTMFVNKALQGDREDEKVIADLSVLEFMYCLQAEQGYLDRQLEDNDSRNIFFDTHYTKVKAWSHILEKEELQALVAEMGQRNKGNEEFMQQLGYYAKAFQKVFG